MNQQWYRISLLFLFIIALLGSVLRATHLVSIPLEYRHLIHAHSHVAFQGWVYTLLILLCCKLFLSPEQIAKGQFELQYKLTLAVIAGVLISFSMQGYGLYSIIFSSLFQVLNYWFVFAFFRELNANCVQHTYSVRFVKTGFWLGLLSTLAPWAIGILAAKGLAGGEAYNSAIYFFLHFQYNGWFLFVLIGLVLKQMEVKKIAMADKLTSRFLLSLTLATLFGYSLSLLGMSFREIVIVPAIIASALSIMALWYFIKIFFSVGRSYLIDKPFITKLLLYTAFVAFVSKIILQLASIVPYFKDYAFGNRFVIVAYLHLCLIALISFALLGLLLNLKWIKKNVFSKVGVLLLWLGFVGSEIFLVAGGLGIFYFPTILLICSTGMAAGVLCLLIAPCTKCL